ncbi:MAG: DoxX family protein [Acidobacteriaceae bacterium]|nr:DoxX family protein [Acidobacteriaceae bacterium]
MAPFVVLVVASLAFWLAGRLGVTTFQHISTVLRMALALMFLLTASAHWGKRRPDLIRMVPPQFPRPDLLVTISGMLEIAGAIGLLIPSTATAAAICLALLLLALFPANVHAARKNLTIAGQPVPGIAMRTAIQIVFVAALVSAAVLK